MDCGLADLCICGLMGFVGFLDVWTSGTCGIVGFVGPVDVWTCVMQTCGLLGFVGL